MKGVILHGGSGTRLRPLTYTDVKQLLPIAGKPVSEYALDNLKELGITDVNIIIGEVGNMEVQSYYGDGSKWGLNISYTYQGKPLGIAHAIGLLKDFVKNDDFIVVLGDNYFQKGLRSLYEDFRKQEFDSFIALTKVTNPKQFGIAVVANGMIVKLEEKPEKSQSNLAITGAYFLTPSIFQAIDKLKPSWRNELEITEAFQIMLEEGKKIGYSIIDGWWKDTGTSEEFLDCNRMVLDKIESNSSKCRGGSIFGRVTMGQGSEIRGKSKVMGPVYIGRDTVIEDSYIGPYTSIGNRCTVRNAEIEDSVIMDGCTIALRNGKRIRESVLGPNVIINPFDNDHSPMRLILGRDSRIEL